MSSLPAIAEALRLAKTPFKPAAAVVAPAPKGVNFHGGLISSDVPGRTDAHPLNVPAGAYVIPADIVSAMGQGNTEAGARAFQEIAKDAPYHADQGAYGTDTAPTKRGSGPPSKIPPARDQNTAMNEAITPKAQGGPVGLVPILAAGGEVVVPPHVVRWLGDGDLEKGHKALDQFVLDTRKKLIETLKKLKGPAKPNE